MEPPPEGLEHNHWKYFRFYVLTMRIPDTFGVCGNIWISTVTEHCVVGKYVLETRVFFFSCSCSFVCSVSDLTNVFFLWSCSLTSCLSSSRAPSPPVVGVVAKRPARDHHHSASQLLGLVVSGSPGGAGGRGLPGEGGRRAAPHGGQRALGRAAAVGVGQVAHRHREGERGERRRGQSGVSGRGRADESQALLQPTGHGGASERRSDLPH